MNTQLRFRTLIATLALAAAHHVHAQLTVSNVRAAQRAGTKLVDVDYDMTGIATPVAVSMEISGDGGTTWVVPVATLSGAIGGSVTPGSNLRITWNAGADWNSQGSTQTRFRLKVDDLTTDLVVFAQIPSGNFTMGDTMDGDSDAPPHTVSVSTFYMQKKGVTKADWDAVRTWGLTHGYTDLSTAAGKSANHPVQTLTWYDAVKWCNARSEKEGLAPCYYTDDAQTTVYRTGSADISNSKVKWTAKGYRLPTEAEREKAARGGLSGKRFPWGDTITHSQANYYANSGYSYDLSPTQGYHPTYAVNGTPYTSPVGSFAANGYGLYDMAGNVAEMTWDWYDSGYYAYSPVTDPHGPASGSNRGLRGGSWHAEAYNDRVARRDQRVPSSTYYGIGFRAVRTSIVTADSSNITVNTNNASLTINSLHGAVSGAGQYALNSTATLTATPDPGYDFTGWTGDASGTDNPLSLLMDTDKVIGAAFTAYTVGNVRATQRPGTNLVDITYDITADTPTVVVTLEISNDGGTTFSVSPTTVIGAIGERVAVGTGKIITWDAGADWNQQYNEQMRFRITVNDRPPLALIPAGAFQMGDQSSPQVGYNNERPVHTVQVSAYYMGKYEVTKGEWDAVRAWGGANGYTDLAAGGGKAIDHPVQTVSWWDVIKWCNSRSEKEGLTPCYTVGGSVMKTGTTSPTVNWAANGYRLPSEAEWENAARGGLSGKNFPWGDIISHTQANFYNAGGESYQTGTTGYHPTYNDGVYPYTSPVGSFAPNGYGLYDMAGNVWEWCWDWFGNYASGTQTDPHGAASGSYRVLRGGCWGYAANQCRVAYRANSRDPGNETGLRLVCMSAPVGGSAIAVTPNSVVDTRAEVTLTANAQHGTVSGAGTYLHNATAILTATPDPGYDFTGWSGDATGTDNPLSVLMDRDKTIVATFAPQSSAKDILTFAFPGLPAATISTDTVSVTVPYGTVVTNLAPAFTVSPLASGAPASGTAMDFTSPKTYTVTAEDGSTKIYTVTVIRQSAIESWRQSSFGSTTSNTGDSEDFDHDGVTNLNEFAFGMNPTVPGNGQLQYSGTFAGGGTISATGQPKMAFESTSSGMDLRTLFVRRKDYAAAGLTYTVQFSADLATWKTSAAVPTVLADDGTCQIVSVPYPPFVNGRKARFFRVGVSITP